MEITYREEQVDSLAKKLNLNKNLVSCVLNNYIYYLRTEISEGRTVKFLNICYLRVKGDIDNRDKKTSAYIATEMGKEVGVSGIVALRILKAYEDEILSCLQEGNGFSVRGLVRMRLDEKGRLRVRKSTVYNNEDVYIITLGSFKHNFGKDIVKVA